MTRISSFNANQNLMFQIMNAQMKFNEAQMQVSSGKKATNLGDHGRDAHVAVATMATRDRYQSYANTATKLKSELDAQALALKEITQVAQDLRQAMMEAVASGKGTAMMEQAESAFQRATSVLNTNFGGKYLFGGGRTDTPPVSVQNLEELSALTASDDAFVNDNLVQATRIDDGVTVSYGLRAKEDIASDLYSAFKTLNDYATANGDLIGDLSEAHMTELRTQLQNLPDIISGLTTVEAKNGAVQNRVENAINRQEDRLITLNELIGKMTDADMAEAATNLQLAQTTMQASAQAFSMLQRTSLLDYL